MRIGRPRTLLGLILVGMGLVALPLLVAIGNAAIKLGALTHQSEAVATEGATTSLESQRILSLLGDMERNARQYFVLTDARLFTLYDKDQASLEQSIMVLLAEPREARVVRDLHVLGQGAAAVRTILHSRIAPNAAQKVLSERFDAMNRSAQAIIEGMRVARNMQLTALQESTRDTQRRLFWECGALLPITGLVILLFLGLVGRPLRQVDRAITELGVGDFSHAIAVTGPRDIEALGRQLEWLRQRLKEQSEEKNKFLRHMSHELKTPLANIREGSELLLDGSVGNLDAQQHEVASILRDNGRRLQQLIENLLNFSAWQTKAAPLTLSAFALQPLVKSVLAQHRLTISNQNIDLQTDASPVEVLADADKLRLTLDNLISNAIKFLPDGGILRVGAHATETEIVIDVADTGPGVAPEDAGRIFEAFYQGRGPQAGKLAGTGIGLSIVAECVQAHGGTVTLVDNEEHHGAHFRVRLPLRRVDSQPTMVLNG